MIIKFKTRKNIYTAKQLVNYILTDKGKIKDPFESFVLLHNISTLDTLSIHRAFVQNDKYRKQRKGGTALYHEQISIHPKDKEKVTNAMLEDLVNHYIQLRGATRALVLAKAHLHSDNPHIHVMLSSNEVRSKQLIRLSRAELDELRTNFEAYQQAQYPELTHSSVYLSKKPEPCSCHRRQQDQNTRSEKEFQQKRRVKQMTDKEKLTEIIRQIFELDISQVKAQLKKHPELQFYRYRKQLVGVKYKGRTYRFQTLGISPLLIERMIRAEKRLRMITKNQSKERELQLGLGI